MSSPDEMMAKQLTTEEIEDLKRKNPPEFGHHPEFMTGVLYGRLLFSAAEANRLGTLLELRKKLILKLLGWVDGSRFDPKSEGAVVLAEAEAVVNAS